MTVFEELNAYKHAVSQCNRCLHGDETPRVLCGHCAISDAISEVEDKYIGLQDKSMEVVNLIADPKHHSVFVVSITDDMLKARFFKMSNMCFPVTVYALRDQPETALFVDSNCHIYTDKKLFKGARFVINT